MTLYLDMDGVLSNFDQGLRAFGIPKNDISRAYRPKSEWTKDEISLDIQVTECMSYTGFWATLPIIPDARELWEHCQPYKPKILTAAPSNLPDLFFKIKAAKWHWIQEVFGDVSPKDFICCYRHEKKQYAPKVNNLNILIDDMEKNIEEWNKFGGHGILHTTASNSITELGNLSKELSISYG